MTDSQSHDTEGDAMIISKDDREAGGLLNLERLKDIQFPNILRWLKSRMMSRKDETSIKSEQTKEDDNPPGARHGTFLESFPDRA